ncbi:hypothetical protein FNV43_RR10239 [Rhamnella rubrinervis]|uniref:Uncharacterized protein n=1 Tax=Rhamnella rubrinervis TaxID=2594499 RepID=A0A8K0ML49_9ROSA|nr:hypothetical protein FNV43_RR10239 [Rhamnella rubrinervis]
MEALDVGGPGVGSVVVSSTRRLAKGFVGTLKLSVLSGGSNPGWVTSREVDKTHTVGPMPLEVSSSSLSPLVSQSRAWRSVVVGSAHGIPMMSREEMSGDKAKQARLRKLSRTNGQIWVKEKPRDLLAKSNEILRRRGDLNLRDVLRNPRGGIGANFDECASSFLKTWWKNEAECEGGQHKQGHRLLPSLERRSNAENLSGMKYYCEAALKVVEPDFVLKWLDEKNLENLYPVVMAKVSRVSSLDTTPEVQPGEEVVHLEGNAKTSLLTTTSIGGEATCVEASSQTPDVEEKGKKKDKLELDDLPPLRL